MPGPQNVSNEAKVTGPVPKPGARPVAAPTPVPKSPTDRYAGPRTAPIDDNQKLADLVKAVEAQKAGPALAPGATPAAAAPKESTEQAGTEPKAESDGRDGYVKYQAPQVSRPVYTGGAPALKPAQMDQAMVKNNLMLRALYALEDKAPWLLKGYMGFTKVAGPIGAWLNLGYNAYSARKILSDPRAPMVLKAGVVGSTGMAGVSAVAATRVGLHAFNVWPMATEGAKLAGKVAGVAGLGAGTILSAMDTFNTFRNPKSTSAEKGFSLLGTGFSAGLTVAVLVGLTGPVGIGLGIGAVAFTLAKGFLGNNKYANAVFDGIGKGVSAAGGAVVGAVKAVGSGLASAASSVAGGFKEVFSGW